MKNLTFKLTLVLFLSLFAVNAQQNPIAMQVVTKGAFDINNPCGDHIGVIGKYIRENIHTSGVYDITVKGITYAVIVDVINDNNTHILFADTQCGKKNYTTNSKNYLDAVGGKIWAFENNPSEKRFAQCNNLIAQIKTFETRVVTNTVVIDNSTTTPETSCGCPDTTETTIPIVNEPVITTCQDSYRQMFPNQVAMFESTNDLSHLNGGIFNGQKFGKMAMRKCFTGKSFVARNWKEITVVSTVVIGGVVWYILSDGTKTTKKPDENWGGNTTNHGESFNANTTGGSTSNANRSTQMVYQRGQRVNSGTNSNVSLLNGRKN